MLDGYVQHIKGIARGEPFRVGPSLAAGNMEAVDGRKWQARAYSLKTPAGSKGEMSWERPGTDEGRLRLRGEMEVTWARVVIFSSALHGESSHMQS